eukprot:668890-Pelagomonas_calceolata.AAC.2
MAAKKAQSVSSVRSIAKTCGGVRARQPRLLPAMDPVLPHNWSLPNGLICQQKPPEAVPKREKEAGKSIITLQIPLHASEPDLVNLANTHARGPHQKLCPHGVVTGSNRSFRHSVHSHSSACWESALVTRALQRE